MANSIKIHLQSHDNIIRIKIKITRINQKLTDALSDVHQKENKYTKWSNFNSSELICIHNLKIVQCIASTPTSTLLINIIK